jgi:hypothetical protein
MSGKAEASLEKAIYRNGNRRRTMSEQNKPDENGANTEEKVEREQKSRRDFLRSLGRWSAIIIGGATLGGMMGTQDAEGSVNGGGGGWVNARGGGGSAGWVNRSGGGSWVNRGGGWINGGGGGWVNSRGSWVNR